MPNNVFILNSKSDETNIFPLISGNINVTPFPLDQGQNLLDESTKIEAVDMSEEEIAAYMAGYNETPFAQKEW